MEPWDDFQHNVNIYLTTPPQIKSWWQTSGSVWFLLPCVHLSSSWPHQSTRWPSSASLRGPISWQRWPLTDRSQSTAKVGLLAWLQWQQSPEWMRVEFSMLNAVAFFTCYSLRNENMSEESKTQGILGRRRQMLHKNEIWPDAHITHSIFFFRCFKLRYTLRCICVTLGLHIILSSWFSLLHPPIFPDSGEQVDKTADGFRLMSRPLVLQKTLR